MKNGSGIPEFFRITPQLFASIGAEFPQARERIELRIEDGDTGLESGLRWAQILFTYRFPTQALRQRAPALRWIQLTGAGLDHLLPLDWLPADIALTTASGAHRPAVDEFIMAAVLALNRRFTEMMTQQRERRWQFAHNRVVRGKTALVIGVGAIGGAAAESCKKLGMRTIGVRRSRRPHPFVDAMHGIEDLEALLPEADYVIVAVPKTPQSLGTLRRRHLERLKPGSGLINLGRLGIVDDAALVELLQSGHLAGAIYDLENPESVPFDARLWSARNLLIVPHCATNDPASFTPNTVRIFYQNLERHLAGRPLANRVDAARGY